MPRHRFVVTGIRSQNNVHGAPMVRIEARAEEGTAFQPEPEHRVEGQAPPKPDGFLTMLVSESFVRDEGILRGSIIDPRFGAAAE